jgi:hypothetical protein
MVDNNSKKQWERDKFDKWIYPTMKEQATPNT